MRGLCIVLLAAFTAITAAAQSSVVLTGTVSPSEAPGYRMLPFQVPSGTKRISVELEKNPGSPEVMAALGLYGPLAYRGMGRQKFFVATNEATPPFQAGPVEPGQWQVLLSVYHVPDGQPWPFRVKVDLSTHPDDSSKPALQTGARWYTGDLHSHTGHSDGACPSTTGKIVPCPPYKLVEAAHAQGLDFLIITDHNTSTTLNAIRELQPYFDRLLLIHGREMTTSAGHSNLWGTSAEVDFRIGFAGYTVNDYIRQSHAAGGVVSINHPYWPISTNCPGCGWGWRDTDYAQIDAIEVINGYRQENPRFKPPPGNGIPFWEDKLRQGYRITAVGGGDDHQSGLGLPHSGVGLPRVQVYATELSEPAILAGIRAGHVYVKAEGAKCPELELTVEISGGAPHLPAMVGDNVSLAHDEKSTAKMKVTGGSGTLLQLFWDGTPVESATWPVSGSEWTKEWPVAATAGRHWLRAEIRDAKGTLLTLSNPIYFGFDAQAGH